MTVTFGPDHILFASYRFPWASVHPHGVVTAADIRSASWEAGPLEIHSRSGETLFLAWDDQAGLTQFCERHGIPAADPALPGTLGDPAEIYRWAMEVADCGRAQRL